MSLRTILWVCRGAYQKRGFFNTVFVMKRVLPILFLFVCFFAKAQVFTFQCVDSTQLTGINCDVCPSTNNLSRSFCGLLIFKNAVPYKWIDQPYTIRLRPGNSIEYIEQIPSIAGVQTQDRITISRSQTGFSTSQGMIDSTVCHCATATPETTLFYASDSIDYAPILRGDTLLIVGRGVATVEFDSLLKKYVVNVDSVSSGTPTANNGVSDNEAGGILRLGNRYMATPDAPFTMARKINIDGRLLHIGDLSDSTLFVVDGAADAVGIHTDAPAKMLHVNGEVRVSDLSNGTPDRVVGANSSGDLSRLFLSGMSVLSGVLTATDSSATNEIQQIDTFTIVSNILRASLSQDGVPFKSVDLSPYLGTGTVTNFSANDLAPLFTTTEATPTTTPVLSFALTNAGANTYFGNATGVGAAPSYTAAGALTKTDDTNVTMTLGGNPNTSLLRAASMTLGWTGTLAVGRGGIGVNTITGIMQGNGTGAVTGITNSSTVGQILRVTGASTYAWGALDLADADAVTGDLPLSNVAQGTARSVLGVTGNAGADWAAIQGTADQVLRVTTAGTALSFGTVATGGIADDAVTYAKLQNVVANNVLLGNDNGANQNAQELTVAEVYTLLGLTGVDQRIAVWKGATTLGNEAGLTFDYANDRQTITCDLPGSGAGAAALNIANVGTDATGEFLQMRGNMSGNMIASMTNLNNTAAANTIWNLTSGGSAAGDPIIQFTISGQQTVAIGVDNDGGDRFKITPNSATHGGNADMGIIVRDNAGTGNTGINKDFPGHPLDGLGRAAFELWQGGAGNAWTFGANVAYGNGAGTGPSGTTIVGHGNAVRLLFSTGTTPTADGDVLILSYPFTFTTTSIVTFSARNSDGTQPDFYISAESNTGCTLKVRGTLTASTPYHINFHIWGY